MSDRSQAGLQTHAAAETRLLATCMVLARVHDNSKEYEKRNQQILMCLHYAIHAGYECGIRIDPKEPEWPVAYVELPQGQVSWHLKQHVKEWDGHTTEQKYERVMAFHKAVYGG